MMASGAVEGMRMCMRRQYGQDNYMYMKYVIHSIQFDHIAQLLCVGPACLPLMKFMKILYMYIWIL